MGLNSWAEALGAVFSKLQNLRATFQHNVGRDGGRGQTGGTLGCLGHARFLQLPGRRVMPTLVVIPGVVMKARVLQSGRAGFESDSSILGDPGQVV